MLYPELQDKVYNLLRECRNVEALIAARRGCAQMEGPDKLDALQLMINTEVLAGAGSLPSAAALIDYVANHPNARLLTRVKARLMGAHISMRLKHADAWRRHLDALEQLLAQAPEWRGRWLISLGDFYEDQRMLDRACTVYREAADWHKDSAGPYDERDRLCHIALSYANSARVLVAVGELGEALLQIEAAESIMPAQALQRFQLYVSRARYHIAAGQFQSADDAITLGLALVETRCHTHGRQMLLEQRAETLYILGKTADAIRCLDELLEYAASIESIALNERVFQRRRQMLSEGRISV